MSIMSVGKFLGLVLLIMVTIFAVKKLTANVNIPVVSQIVQEV